MQKEIKNLNEVREKLSKEYVDKILDILKLKTTEEQIKLMQELKKCEYNKYLGFLVAKREILLENVCSENKEVEEIPLIRI